VAHRMDFGARDRWVKWPYPRMRLTEYVVKVI
jgi:hypothetical protein